MPVGRQGNLIVRSNKTVADSQLRQELINEIRKQGANSLELQVNRNNKAKNFYEKLGFVEREIIKLDIGNGFIMDDYVMENKL